MIKKITLIAISLLYVAISQPKEEKLTVTSINKLSYEKSYNKYYQGTRPPLKTSALIKLPIGHIKPNGWLKSQLELMAQGFTGNLMKISQWCKFEENAWSSPEFPQFGWEELPYWLRGFIDLGYILENKQIIQESKRWIEAVLKNQDKDGYFGPISNKEAYDLWPNMIMIYALRTYYEATQDKRITNLLLNYFRWVHSLPLNKFLSYDQQKYRHADYYPYKVIPKYSQRIWQWWRGGENLFHILWLYNLTGEKWLLDLARINHERTADWSGSIPTWHGVNLTMGFKEPALYYLLTHDERYLKSAYLIYDSIMSTFGQVPGGMFAADENARDGFTDPRQAAETCSMVEFMHSFEVMLWITGDPIWADRCEEIAFNSLPASMTPDLKGLHYLTAPNMVQLDTSNKSPMFDNPGDMLSYNPWKYRCCQHNVSFGWPYFAQHLWMATPDNGIAAVFYSNSTVQAKVGNLGQWVKITEITNYPFSELITFKISIKKPDRFPIVLRIPTWCDQPELYVNGKKVNINVTPPTWLILKNTWKNNDSITLKLPMKIKAKIWSKNKNGVSIYMGPLAFSLKIKEKWEKYKTENDEFPAFQVFPQSPWNYALVIDTLSPEKNIKISKLSQTLSYQPFSIENSPIELTAKARKLPEWKLENNGLVGLLPQSPVVSNEPIEDITLIPMGCARLRISVFPYTTK